MTRQVALEAYDVGEVWRWLVGLGNVFRHVRTSLRRSLVHFALSSYVAPAMTLVADHVVDQASFGLELP